MLTFTKNETEGEKEKEGEKEASKLKKDVCKIMVNSFLKKFANDTDCKEFQEVLKQYA